MSSFTLTHATTTPASAMQQSRRYILKDDPMLSITPRGIQVPGVSLKNDWLLQGLFNATDSKPRQGIYLTGDEKNTIHLIDDDVVQLQYVVVRGPDPEDVLPRAAIRLPCFRDDELWDLANSAKSVEELKLSVLRLGVSAPTKFEARRAKFLVEQLSHRDPSIRHAAIIAIGYAAWSELSPPLKRVSCHDADVGVRDHAARMVEGLALTIVPDEDGKG